MSETARRSTPGTRVATTLVLAIACLAGLVISVIQTWEHFGYCADPAAFEGAVCGPQSGCGASFWSPLSELPPGHCAGVPISLVAASFYLTFLVLTVVRHRATAGSATDRTVRRLQFGLALPSVLVSIALAVYSLVPKLDPSGTEVSGLCLLCTVLYAVNAVLLIGALVTRGEPLAAHARGMFGAAWSRLMAVTVAVFLGVGGLGFFAYQTALDDERAVVAAAKAHATPDAPRTFDLVARPTVGPEKARLQIVEFADFQCPHCKLLFHTLEGFRAAHPEDVRLTFFSFPLDQACNRMIDRPFHERACELARFAACAHQQGRFSETAKILFDHPTALQPELLGKLAGIGVDADALTACAAAPATLAHVKADIEAGIAAKIEGTPAVFVNGELVGGARDRDFFEALLEKKTQAGN